MLLFYITKRFIISKLILEYKLIRFDKSIYGLVSKFF